MVIVLQSVFKQFLAPKLFTALLVLVSAYLLARVLGGVLSIVASRLATARFRVTTLIPLVKFVVYATATYLMVAFLFDFSSDQILAFSGLLGAALGFGLRDLIADLIGGLVIVTEQPYQIGDMVSVGEYYGEIQDIGLRSTKLLTWNDTLVSVPNFMLFNESVANANAGQAEMMVVVEFYVDTETPPGQARKIVSDAVVTSPFVYVTDDLPANVYVEDELYYRTIRARAYVTDLRHELDFKHDVSERVLDAFDEAGIESPRVPSELGSAPSAGV
jgi:small-conductance mechanosensitive channel